MTKETGGPAFPIVQDACPGVHSGGVESWGLSIRDYFAAKALVAYFSDGAGFALQHEASKWAYETADAMLEARK